MTATLLLQIAAKATLVLLGGLALTRAMSQASAAARHLVWVLTLAAALAVPAMHAAGPVWTLAVLPAGDAPSAPASFAPAPVATAPVEAAPTVTPPSPADWSDVVGQEPLPLEDVDVAHLVLQAPQHPTPPAAASSKAAPPGWGEILVGVWVAGMAFMCLRLIIGLVWASLTVRAASDLPDTAWQDSLDEAIMALALTRPVGLKVSERTAVPMATGIWRAVVLLPLTAIDWPEERRRVVLQHELAHVKRRDCLLQALAHLVCAVHWFNPFAHVAVARLRAEQENACDDMVIQVGTDARSYAGHLFEIARSFRAEAFPSWVAMSMARPSQLEGRMLAILDSARARYAPSGSVRAALLVATVLVALPFGALRLTAQAPPTSERVTAATEMTQEPAGVPAHGEPAMVDPADAGVAVDTGIPVAAAVELVRGELTEVELLELMPSLAFGDAVRALHAHREPTTARAFMDATKAVNWLTIEGTVFKGLPRAAAGGAAAQGTAAVSDETRKRVADALITALDDENPQVRQEALTSLASMRDERAIPGLIRALGDPMTEVRMRALGALVQFESMTAADGVLTALKDRDADVREMAARHLASVVSRGQLRDAKYVEAFSALLKDDNADVREQAVVALGRLRVPAASGALTQALRDGSPDVRQQAARALAQLGSNDAVPAIIPLLKDPAKDVREQAALALGMLADPRAIDALTAALKDAEPSVREQAARALGQIARGQRRGVRPVAPIPPRPPLPPRASIDPDHIRDIEERARDAAERARDAAERATDAAMRRRDFDLRFGPFELPDVPPLPEPAPPAPPAPPTPPR